MFSIQPSQWIWLVYIPIPNLAKKFRSFYTNWTYVTGNTYWCSWSLFSSNWWLQNMWIIVPLFYSNLKNIYSDFLSKIHSTDFHYLFCRAKSHIYRQCYVTNAVKYGSFVIGFFFPMPQLTPDCNRVVVSGLLPSDSTDFNPLYVIRLLQMMMEILISEDYCLSNIIVGDFGNITLRRLTGVTPSIVKKYELCVLVSSTYIICVYKDNTA